MIRCVRLGVASLRVLLAMFLCAEAAFGQVFPVKPVHVVLPVPPGGLQDSLARAMAPELTRMWGQAVVVENRAGANGIIAGEAVVKAAPDGHALFMGTVIQLSNDLLPNRSVPFNPMRDLVPVIQLVEAGNILTVGTQSTARTLQDLIALARAMPGSLNYGSFGIGSAPHVDTVALSAATGIKVVHIPYKGGAEVLQAIMTGQVAFALTGITAALPLVRQGRLRALAVGGRKRSSLLPEVPTLDEAGMKGFESGGWFGWFAPAATPRPVVDRIASSASRVITAPEFRERYIVAAGLEVANVITDAFADRIRTDREIYSARLRGLDVKLD